MRKSPEMLLRLRNSQLALRCSESEQSPSAVITSSSVLEVLGKHAMSPWTRRRLRVTHAWVVHGPSLPSSVSVDKGVIDLSLLELDGEVVPRFLRRGRSNPTVCNWRIGRVTSICPEWHRSVANTVACPPDPDRGTSRNRKRGGE